MIYPIKSGLTSLPEENLQIIMQFLSSDSDCRSYAALKTTCRQFAAINEICVKFGETLLKESDVKLKEKTARAAALVKKALDVGIPVNIAKPFIEKYDGLITDNLEAVSRLEEGEEFSLRPIIAGDALVKGQIDRVPFFNILMHVPLSAFDRNIQGLEGITLKKTHCLMISFARAWEGHSAIHVPRWWMDIKSIFSDRDYEMHIPGYSETGSMIVERMINNENPFFHIGVDIQVRIWSQVHDVLREYYLEREIRLLDMNAPSAIHDLAMKFFVLDWTNAIFRPADLIAQYSSASHCSRCLYIAARNEEISKALALRERIQEFQPSCIAEMQQKAKQYEKIEDIESIISLYSD